MKQNRFDRLGLILSVFLFAVPGIADSPLLSGNWQSGTPKESDVKVENEAVRIRVLSEQNQHGAYQKMLTLPEGKEYVFSARVSGDRAGMAYLSVKLFRGNREIRRFSSPLNQAFSRTLSVAFSTKESGDVQILLRTIHSRENVGAEAVFRDLKLEEKTPPVTAELEIVPGYEVCSIYLNSLSSSSGEQFRGSVFFREKGAAQWLPALDLVFVPTEKTARGSIVKLREGTEYEGKLEISDAGTTKIRHFRFRTKSPSVPIAKTVVLNRNNFNGHLLIQEEGSPDGYIRYTAEAGFVLRGVPGRKEVILLDNAKYIILDGLTIRGNQNDTAFISMGGSIFRFSTAISPAIHGSESAVPNWTENISTRKIGRTTITPVSGSGAHRMSLWNGTTFTIRRRRRIRGFIRIRRDRMRCLLSRLRRWRSATMILSVATDPAGTTRSRAAETDSKKADSSATPKSRETFSRSAMTTESNSTADR